MKFVIIIAIAFILLILLDIIKFSDNSIPIILLVGLSIIGIIGFTTFKLVGIYDLKKYKKLKQNKINLLEEERIEKAIQITFEENRRLKKIQEEDEQREIEDRMGEMKRLQFKEEQKLKQSAIEEGEKLHNKINNNGNLYNLDVIDSLENSASIRVFYDLEKKRAKYWKETDMLDRIRIKDKEIREEIKIKQNKITLRISVEPGGKHKFAKLISGGAMDFWDHDVGGYTLQAHLSKPEEFLKAILIKHIRRSNSGMVIHDSSHSITAILIRQDADYRDASNILKRIIEKSCDELTEVGDVLVE